MKTGRIILALAGVLTASGLAGAQGPGGPGMGHGFGEHRPPMERAFGDGGRGQFWNNPRIVAQLKLTDDQRKAMDGILQQHKVTLIDLRANLEKAEVTMGPLMKADPPNENAILATIDKTAQARAELEKANARFLLAVRGQLTADQWKQMQAMHENHGEDGHSGHGGWGQDGQGPGSQQFHHGQGRGQGPPPPGAGPGGPPPAAGSQPSGPGTTQ